MDESKFHFYSFGIVAANKPRGTDMCEVFPQEKFTMSVGEITDNVETIEVKGKDADGKDYTGKQQTKPSITCKWLPIGEPNRTTAPDVRRQEQVIIYRYADTEYYFWATAFNNIVRKLETVAWWFSGTPTEGEGADKERTAQNGYFLEFSTHDGHVILSTSGKNGEKATYVMQFDTKNGTFSLRDNLGNIIDLDSVAGILETTTENEVIVNTKKHTTNCKQWILNAETFEANVSQRSDFKTPQLQTSKDFTVDGNSLQKGFANFTTGIGGGNSGDQDAELHFRGNVDQRGNWRTEGDHEITGHSEVGGTQHVVDTATFDKDISAPNV